MNLKTYHQTDREISNLSPAKGINVNAFLEAVDRKFFAAAARAVIGGAWHRIYYAALTVILWRLDRGLCYMITKHLGVVQYPMMKSEEFFLSTFKSNSILAPEMIPIVITVIRGENKKEPVLPVTNTHGIPKWSILRRRRSLSLSLSIDTGLG